MTSQIGKMAAALIKQFYCKCSSLAETLTYLEPSWLACNQDNDTVHNLQLCNDILVGGDEEEFAKFTASAKRSLQVNSSLEELVTRVVQVECTQYPQSVLSTGFVKDSYGKRQVTDNALKIRGFPNLLSISSNSIYSFLKSEFWKWLHIKIGDDLLYFLLHKCSMFYPLQNGSFIQVSGIPIYIRFGSEASLPVKKVPYEEPLFSGNLWTRHSPSIKRKPKSLPSQCGILEAKRLKQSKNKGKPTPTLTITANSCLKGKRSPAQVICYGEVIPTSKKARTINKNKPADKNPKWSRNSSKKKLTSTDRECSKPCKRGTACKRSDILFKRHQIFHSSSMSEKFVFQNLQKGDELNTATVKEVVRQCFTVRKHLDPRSWSNPNIKLCRLTSRLKGVVQPFRRLLKSHQRCRYKHLLAHHCPLPNGFFRDRLMKALDTPKELETGILGYMTFHSLVMAYTPIPKVFNFVRSVCEKVIPMELWGTVENKNVFYKHLNRFISLRYFEQYSLAEAMEDFKVSSCHWARKKGSSAKHMALSDSAKQVEMVECFLVWIMNFFIMPLLKSHFYITASAEHKNHIFYYRKLVWRRIVDLSLKDLKQLILLPKMKRETAELYVTIKKTFGVAVMRLLPRRAGVRPIMNLGSKKRDAIEKQCSKQSKLSINQQLQDLFLVLNYVKSTRRNLIGSAVFGIDDVYSKWKKFVTMRRKGLSSQNQRRLYFLSMDISNCYDSIPQDKLMKIMENAINRKEYPVKRFCRVSVRDKRVRREFVKKATLNEHGCFVDFAEQLAAGDKSNSSSIFVDQVKHHYLPRETVLKDLKKLIQANVIKFLGKYYRQGWGIPQGSSVSALLCSFFYGDMERKVLPNVSTKRGLLMRFFDDFLLVTEDGETALNFLHTLSKGIQAYNCYISHRKTQTNFKVLEDGTLAFKEGVTTMSWCGLCIDTNTLEISCDYSRFMHQDPADSLTVVRNKHPLRNLRRKLMWHMKLKPVHLVFTDVELNSQEHVLLHVYQTFTVLAMKYTAYVAELHMKKLYKYNLQLFGIIISIIRGFYSGIYKKNKEVKRCSKIPAFSLIAILGLKAFCLVLEKNDSKLENRLVLRRLRSNLKMGLKKLNEEYHMTIKKLDLKRVEWGRQLFREPVL